MGSLPLMLCYLQGTIGLGIRYTGDLERLKARDQELNVLYALSDSDFAWCKDTSCSTSGYMILMNGGVIACYSGRQTTMALCTAVVETIALAKLVVKIKDVRALFFDLQCRQEQETKIKQNYCRHHDQTIYQPQLPHFVQPRNFAMGMLDIINIVSAAAAEIWHLISIHV
jgi:hypothetical protein